MSKKPTPKVVPPFPAVYQDANRHTCIVVFHGEEQVEFIPLETAEMECYHMSAERFDAAYRLMADYPVKRAAEIYALSCKGKKVSEEAREHLNRILANPAFNYDASQFQPPLKGEQAMTDPITALADSAVKATPSARPLRRASDPKPAAKKAAAAPAKKNGAPAAKKAAPAAKKATAPAKKAAPAAKKPAAKKSADSGGTGGAPSKYPMDAKITVVAKENPKRAGTKAHAEFELYKKASTVQQYVDKGGTLSYLNYDVAQGFVKVTGGTKK